MSTAMVPDGNAKSAGPEDKVRKDLVQVFFGLVLGQIAVYVASLIEVWNPHSLEYAAAWSHTILAFALTTTSWFGWQMSVRKAQLIDEASVFQKGFVLSIIDIILVTLYFLLVHQVELEGVAAFPPTAKPVLTMPNVKPEVLIIIVIFSLYAVWDTARLVFKEVDYGPWPSAACVVLSALGLVPALAAIGTQPVSVILTDAYLLGLVFFFRAFKRLQKWNHVQNKNDSTFRIYSAPFGIRMWIVFWSVFSLFMYLGAVLPLVRLYVNEQF